MQVILKQDFPSLGYVGEKVSVRRGYARNFLIPRGIASEMGSRNAKLIAHKVAGINAHKSRLKVQAEELAKQISQVQLEFTLKLGAHGKSFGAVSQRDIEMALQEKGFKFDRKQLRLAEPIKGGGTFDLHVRLHSEVALVLPIKVIVERVTPKDDGAAEGAKGRGRRRRARGAADEQSEGHDEQKAEAAEDSAAADE